MAPQTIRVVEPKFDGLAMELVYEQPTARAHGATVNVTHNNAVERSRSSRSRTT